MDTKQANSYINKLKKRKPNCSQCAKLHVITLLPPVALYIDISGDLLPKFLMVQIKRMQDPIGAQKTVSIV